MNLAKKLKLIADNYNPTKITKISNHIYNLLIEHATLNAKAGECSAKLSFGDCELYSIQNELEDLPNCSKEEIIKITNEITKRLKDEGFTYFLDNYDDYNSDRYGYNQYGHSNYKPITISIYFYD